jgi:putative transposase
MPNHWHFVVRPTTDDELSRFFRWLTHTHVMRWHAHYHTEGTGHLYQGRFKTFPPTGVEFDRPKAEQTVAGPGNDPDIPAL